jgi:hypothetical protein
LEVLSNPISFGKRDMTDGVATVAGTIPWKGTRLRRKRDLNNPIWSKVFRKRRLRELPPSTRTVELDIFYDGADYQRIPPRLWNKVRVVAVVEGNGDLRPSKVLRGGGTDHQDLPGCEVLFPPGLIRDGATKNIVDLLVCLGEVTLVILGLLLLIGQLGRLENLIC